MTQSHAKDGDPRQRPLRMAVLLSGSGRTLQNLGDAINAGRLHASIDLVISSRPGVQGITRAANLGLTAVIVPRKQFKTPSEFSDVIWRHIRDAGVDLVVLAGFLSWIAIPGDYQHRVVNIHPALLPAFGGPGMYGHHVHEAVLAHGAKISGCTVHFCDEQYDNGPILLQRTCPVMDDDDADTLAARVFEQECQAYLDAAMALAQRRILTIGRRTFLLPDADWVERSAAACRFAHAGQTRAGGSPYAQHPIAVAKILVEHGVSDPAVLVAAHLHDVLEDTPVLAGDLDLLFGEPVRRTVEELTVPKAFEDPSDRKHEYLIGHASKLSDQAKLIKLADRLHNVRELSAKPADKQARYVGWTVKLLAALEPWPSPTHAKLAEVIRAAMRAYGV
jgi:phosphoribosylglycinamide formyltransferase-1